MKLTTGQKITLIGIILAFVGTIYHFGPSVMQNNSPNITQKVYVVPDVPLKNKEQTSEPVITFIYPRNGVYVGFREMVNGTITGVIPDDHYVWIMVNPIWLPDQWWPQYGKPIQPMNNKWAMLIEVGNETNVGEFNLAAVLVDSAGNDEIKSQVNSEAKGSSMGLPTNSKTLAAVTVKRK